MEEANEVLPNIMNGLKTGEGNTTGTTQGTAAASSANPKLHYKWWIQMIIYTILVLAGQNVGTLLGRVYFNNGGKSEWMATLIQTVGFPILFPFLWLTAPKKSPNEIHTRNWNWNWNWKPFLPMSLALVYLLLGVFLAAVCMLYTIGLQYLPVTTYTLICASQLGFNALFSYFLNKQKFTPYIVNSLVLLTISSVLLVFQTDPGDSNKSPRNKYAIGFLCTLAASAGYALMLAIMQLAFQRIVKKDGIQAVVEMSIAQSLVATILILVGIFGSGDWKHLHREMEGYASGKTSYVMNLLWTAVSWQAFTIGSTGLIFKVSSLFSNVISILGLPVAPVLAVIFLHDKLTGLKAVSMVLAMWGFASYMYQHYLDDLEKKKIEEEDSEVALMARRG